MNIKRTEFKDKKTQQLFDLDNNLQVCTDAMWLVIKNFYYYFLFCALSNEEHF